MCVKQTIIHSNGERVRLLLLLLIIVDYISPTYELCSFVLRIRGRNYQRPRHELRRCRRATYVHEWEEALQCCRDKSTESRFTSKR